MEQIFHWGILQSHLKFDFWNNQNVDDNKSSNGIHDCFMSLRILAFIFIFIVFAFVMCEIIPD